MLIIYVYVYSCTHIYISTKRVKKYYLIFSQSLKLQKQKFSAVSVTKSVQCLEIADIFR